MSTCDLVLVVPLCSFTVHILCKCLQKQWYQITVEEHLYHKWFVCLQMVYLFFTQCQGFVLHQH